MWRRAGWNAFIAAFFLFFALSWTEGGLAQDKPGLKGWGIDGEYNKLYSATEIDQFKGKVEDIKDITPMAGMDPGIGLIIKDPDADAIEVHVGPKSFVKLDSIGLKKGDKVKVKGVWAVIGDKEIFMASKVKKGEDTELKVRRTRDGTPYWTMTPEEIAKEKEE